LAPPFALQLQFGSIREYDLFNRFRFSPFVQVCFAGFKSRFLMLLNCVCESGEPLKWTRPNWTAKLHLWNCACLWPYI